MSLSKYKVVESVWQLSIAAILVSSCWRGWRLRLFLWLTLRLTLSVGRLCDMIQCYGDVIVNFFLISLCLIDWLVFLDVPVVSYRRMSCV